MRSFAALCTVSVVLAVSSSCSKERSAASDSTDPAAASGSSALRSASSAAKRKLPPAPPDVAGPPPDAIVTPSGLAYKVLAPGTGQDHPRLDETVLMHYSGWTVDGEGFDSTRSRNRPVTLRIGQGIEGWTEGLQLMTVGEKARFWIPKELAYGDAVRRNGKPSGMLVFDIELLEIRRAPEPPIDVAAPPAKAKKTPSGLAYVVLEKGTGTRHPSATDKVRIEYTSWTPDGKLYRGSALRGGPSTVRVTGIIKGLTEGLQLMVEGERTMFWVPEQLAYGAQPRRGAPSGTVVFDVKLLGIE